MDQLWPWIGFNALVLALLALDLGVFHRSAHAISLREAAAWSVAWVALALGFNAGVYHFLGKQAGMESTAKIRSVVSTSTRTTNSGVASRRARPPSPAGSRMKKLGPW